MNISVPGQVGGATVLLYVPWWITHLTLGISSASLVILKTIENQTAQ